MRADLPDNVHAALPMAMKRRDSIKTFYGR